VGGACPTCGRPLGGEYHAVLEMLDTQLGDVKQNGQFYRARIDQLRDVPADVLEADALRHGLEAVVEAAAQDLAVARRAAEEAASLEQQVKALEGRRARLAAEAAALRGGYDRERHDGVRRRVAELEPAVLRAQALRRDAGRADAVGQALRAAEERRAGLVERYAALQRELAGLEYDEASFLAAEERMRELERVWRGAEQAVATARAERTLAAERRGEAEQREQEAAARAARLGVLQADVRLHQELDRALDDLSTDLNAEIGPEISALASEFLATLTDGLYDEVQLDEDFEATVYADGEPVPVLSGGEEDLRNLVLRLAVSQMIADRSGQPLSLLVLDEIFGSLDEARSENVMRLLRGLGARFPQVVLITHVEGVRDSLDRIIRVRYDEASGAAIVSEERVPDRLPGGSGADVAA
jgi:exonuclease SbcC